MDADAEVRCCGRQMAMIGIERSATALTLHSCPSCGRHAWRAEGEHMNREALLAALRSAPPAGRDARSSAGAAVRGVGSPGGRSAPTSDRPRDRVAPGAADHGRTTRALPLSDEDRRAELRRLLDAFTVHGTSS